MSFTITVTNKKEILPEKLSIKKNGYVLLPRSICNANLLEHETPIVTAFFETGKVQGEAVLVCWKWKNQKHENPMMRQPHMYTLSKSGTGLGANVYAELKRQGALKYADNGSYKYVNFERQGYKGVLVFLTDEALQQYETEMNRPRKVYKTKAKTKAATKAATAKAVTRSTDKKEGRPTKTAKTGKGITS